MRRVLLMALLALALPVALFADSSSQVDFGNSGGTLAGTNAGMTLTGSTLVLVNGYDGLGMITGDLGTLAFSTGALTSGNLQTGATFAGGGSFTVTANGTNGLPNGVIFQGTFSGAVQWQLFTLSNGTHDYTLTGPLTGTLIVGNQTIQVNGLTVQLTINTGKDYFNGWTSIASGNTNLVVSPEPGTLGLLGTGLVGIAGLVRYRRKINRP